MKGASTLTHTDKIWFISGAAIGISVGFVVWYEYKSRVERTKFRSAIIALNSDDSIETQISSLETLIDIITHNKKYTKTLCLLDSSLGQLEKLINSENEDVQYLSVELICLVSEEDHALETLRHTNIYQTIIQALQKLSKKQDILGKSNETLERAMTVVKNCTRVTETIVQHPLTGEILKVSSDMKAPSDDAFERDEDWYARELYQQHGLESIINQLLSTDFSIQLLALEILSNYCRTWKKNKDEVGELGGVGTIVDILTSKLSEESSKSLALATLRYCVDSCMVNIAKLQKADGVRAICTYITKEAPQSISSVSTDENQQTDVLHSLICLNFILDKENFSQLTSATEKLTRYKKSSNADIAKFADCLLRRMLDYEKKSNRTNQFGSAFP
eukprot:TRINITY_DN6883_c0_g1_i1.p1 TRINITY_DN6883_c0_g1~~TRINITY_DN6883_c0_g1_i1.p1  ORF type:complete len:390 (+),score=87.24 TRINITY_DN6883_c0_g1_i1:49-1218(+)